MIHQKIKNIFKICLFGGSINIRNLGILFIISITFSITITIPLNVKSTTHEPETLIPKRKPNPYLNTINSSKKVNELFNYYFQSNLSTKESFIKKLATDYDPEKFRAQNYLIELPNASELNSNATIDTFCNLNLIDEKNKVENPFLWQTLISEYQNFSTKQNNAYCLLQNTFQNTSKSFPKMVSNINTPISSHHFEKRLDSLSNKDTMVIIIPSLFGETLTQTPFGELFGPKNFKISTSKLNISNSNISNNNPSNNNLSSNSQSTNQSQFALDFNQYIKKNGLDRTNNKNEGLDSQFLIKNLRNFYDSNNNFKNLYQLIAIPDWIKVASIDDEKNRPLFKVALLDFAPMSLESLGRQEELAIIYLRRLNKFMSIYEKQNGNLPDQIILIGYSRGSPVVYEMLSILKNGSIRSDDPEAKTKSDLSKKGQKWFKKVTATVSLGGLDTGASFADDNILFREKSTDKAKALQALFRLMMNIKLINQRDLNTLHSVFQSAMNRNYKVNSNLFYLFTNEEEQRLIHRISKKIASNLFELKLFLKSINDLEIKKTGVNLGKGLLAIKELATIYENLNELVQSKGSNLSQVALLKDLFENLNKDNLNKIFSELVGISHLMYPNLASSSLPSQNELIEKIQSAIKGPQQNSIQFSKNQISINEIYSSLQYPNSQSSSPQASLSQMSPLQWDTLYSLILKNPDQNKIREEFQSLINTVKNPESIGYFLQNFINNSSNTQELINKAKKLLVQLPNPESVVANINSLIEKSPNPDDLLPVKSELVENMIKTSINNYGLIESQNLITNAFYSSDAIALLKEINLNIKLFRHYFITLWQTVSELTTVSRLNWFQLHAQHLPTHFSYYSVGAIQPNPSSHFYKQGTRFGFNISSDQVFLNKTWFDLQNIGENSSERVDGFLFNSSWNDTFVEWHRSILWPQLLNNDVDNSNFPFKTKILGIARTHHWGLALPYVVQNNTSIDPLTGIPTLNNQRVDNINPFPRIELLKSIVMTIDADNEVHQ